MTTYGRANGKRPKDLGDDELTHLYLEANGEDLPIDVSLIRRAMDPVAMVSQRRGLGGPQPSEVLRMLAEHSESLEAEFIWLESSRRQLEDSTAELQRQFDAIH